MTYDFYQEIMDNNFQIYLAPFCLDFAYLDEQPEMQQFFASVSPLKVLRQH
jgi:hypothetical protein